MEASSLAIADRVRSPADFQRSLRLNTLAAVGMLFMLAGLCGAASFVEISGAVIAAGKVVVNSEVKKVQHSTGGVIGEIFVVNGQTVSAGQVVARLDATAAKANLGIISKSLDDLTAKRSRLTAERDDLPAIIFEPDLVARSDSDDVRRVIRTEEGHSFFADVRAKARRRS
ncbi:biotin/lipoyl-binding protein [Aliirhizobium terrae]|uniref:biotin/lipoyl-binding protein n=1 Tax=Terrirhizobium terrae TaxID=2926709 RepID=UPI0025753D1C|nr:biotin/lipoyl-binding protein [Rhizobium sp. CC-CFT758]WJH41111.1 biotin/lipoyl-binding protein [Rhizobium sp. CC-CFT758]